MDTAPIQLTQAVFRKAQSSGIWCLIVPARCTDALQPLDTHVFSPYKAYLLRSFQDAKNEDGVVTDEAWACTLVAVVRKVLNGRRGVRAFIHTGLLGARHEPSLSAQLAIQHSSSVCPRSVFAHPASFMACEPISSAGTAVVLAHGPKASSHSALRRPKQRRL